MTIANYTDLKSAVSAWMHRTDLDSRIPDFIALAEPKINYDIGDILLLLSESTITTSTGTRKYPAPNGFLRLEYVYRREPASTPMQIVSSRSLAEKYAHEQYTSIPQQIAFDGENLVLHPTPNGAFTIDYTYQNEIAKLSNSVPTNEILTRFPGLYLNGALYQAAMFIGNDKDAAKWQAEYQAALQNARSIDYMGNAKLRTNIPTSGNSFNFYTGD